jgi:vancomycin permeability regulator SanA
MTNEAALSHLVVRNVVHVLLGLVLDMLAKYYRPSNKIRWMSWTRREESPDRQVRLVLAANSLE